MERKTSELNTFKITLNADTVMQVFGKNSVYYLALYSSMSWVV